MERAKTKVINVKEVRTTHISIARLAKLTRTTRNIAGTTQEEFEDYKTKDMQQHNILPTRKTKPRNHYKPVG